MGIVYGPGKARRCLLAASPAHSAHAPVERGHQAFVVVDGLVPVQKHKKNDEELDWRCMEAATTL